MFDETDIDIHPMKYKFLKCTLNWFKFTEKGSEGTTHHVPLI